MDRQSPVTELKIAPIELLHLIQPNDMPEIPAYHDVNCGNGSQSDVEHVISKARAEHMMILIGG